MTEIKMNAAAKCAPGNRRGKRKDFGCHGYITISNFIQLKISNYLDFN